MHRMALAFVLLVTLRGVAQPADVAATFESDVLPFLTAYCADCHKGEKPKGQVNLSGQRSLDQLAQQRDLWFKVLAQLDSQAMPPDGAMQPQRAERQSIVAWIRGEFTEMLAENQLRQGRSRLRRLSRTEYANTILDLFGVRPTVGISLPEDGRVDGFDKVSGALPLSASGAAGYLKMSDEILDLVLKPIPGSTDLPKANRVVRAVARESEASKGHVLELPEGWWVSFNSDTTSCPNRGFAAKQSGIHRLKISVYGYQTDQPIAFGIYAGNTASYPQILDLLTVLEAPPDKPAVIEAEVYLKSGDGLRLIPFGLGVQVPKNSIAANCKGPGLAFQGMDVEQPELPILGDRWLAADFPPELNEEIRSHYKVVLTPSGPQNQVSKTTNRDQFLEVMKKTFLRIGPRFYRRDLTEPEISQILEDVAEQLGQGATLDKVYLDKITDLMISPEFLCLIEEPGRLSDFALASRLSYFLWNSTPDEALLELARQGKLHDSRELHEQTERMLNDGKSARFVNEFVNQWLGLRAIDDTSPDGTLYPEYAKNDLLKYSSVMETQGFFRRLLDENLSVRHFVQSQWTLINESLAEHYGLPPVTGVALRKINFPDSSPYGGIWTQPAVMKVTANGTNTSPVKRGVFVAERLLGTPIPPPPPNINPVEPDVRGAKTFREQLALHRGSGSCANCHAKFDPYGFALESFDVTGRFRKHYREVEATIAALAPDRRNGRAAWRDGLPVDCSGHTPDGLAFEGINELRRILANHPEQLARGVVRHLIAYATGSPATAVDQPAIDRIVVRTASEDYGLRSLIHALVQSDLFQSK